ncbi:MAG: TetR/AcrR family transcriptional regulator [SAR324 cluster bacterium]|nr:TetR/AcrR family transcriptional regulator [SAR324 cluster bacterium]
MNPLTYDAFASRPELLKKTLAREVYLKNRDKIKIRNEDIAIKNLIHIFDEVLKLSIRKGFHAMTMRNISEATGMSLGSLYSYFQSKEELLEMIQEQGRAMVEQIFMNSGESHVNAWEKLQWNIRMHLYLTELLQPWFYVTHMESQHFSKARRERLIDGEFFIENIFLTCLREGMTQEIFKIQNPSITVSFLIAMLQDWYLKHWKHKRRGIGVDDYYVELIAWIQAVILPDGRPPVS